ncbi:HugZ family protein [Agrobacterium larrymoorei]|uniref:HugZ family protein n=1 Tax=Agrobacterium larrymoorei TaxID=160699 RepID=A0A4D7DMS4_9HYPH|nr:pyridoxamine 5'-phosphate oxidase family protein [Agrobacterium larrymoorei]QCI97398.1 HugZ family protein [Agrobacterium larrymoorei]QYA07167.1 HugZ family protein [Agrobacterium larrymoorei]
MVTATTPPITPRTAEIEPSAGAPFEAVRIARDVLLTSRTAGLATLDPTSGYPYNTATNIAVEPDGTPFFFAARLALHARNIEADPRISLVLAPFNKGDALTLPRLTLVGKAELIGESEVNVAKARYIARYPKAKLYLALPDTLLYRLNIEGVQINGGPARNASNITPADLRTDFADANALMAAVDDEIGRINAIKGEASRIAVMADRKAGAWKVTSIDPDGINLASAGDLARLWFAERVTSLNQLEKVMTQLSK